MILKILVSQLNSKGLWSRRLILIFVPDLIQVVIGQDVLYLTLPFTIFFLLHVMHACVAN
jgi:hypothetical protein